MNHRNQSDAIAVGSLDVEDSEFSTYGKHVTGPLPLVLGGGVKIYSQPTINNQ